MVEAGQFVLNTIFPSKFSKLQTGEAWAIVTDKEIWKTVRGKIALYFFNCGGWVCGSFKVDLYPFWVSIGDYEQISAVVVGVVHMDPVSGSFWLFPGM